MKKKRKKFNVLIIEDHPFISDAYKNAFREIEKNKLKHFQFFFQVAPNCDVAVDIIKNNKANKKRIDIVLLDIKLPVIKNEEYFSGEEIGVLLREIFPKTKIIVSTTHNDNFRINNIFKSINPDGFLVKNDISSKELIDAIETVIIDPPYYTKTIIKLLRSEISNEYALDTLDRQLLYQLSIGTRTKDLPAKLLMSITGIEKRKRRLMTAFGLSKTGSKTLVQVAKERGFV